MNKLQRVLEYLKEHGSGSKLSIRQATNYDNIGDAIFRLRRKYDIAMVWEYTSTGAKYARYIFKGKLNETM